MNNAEKMIRNIGTSGYIQKKPSNCPVQYKNRKQQYLAEREKAFAERRAYLATDFVTANAQGLTENFYDYTAVDVRLADVTAGTLSEQRKLDDWKEVLFKDSWIDYYPLGAKLVTMGSTWLSYNPSNISSASATAVVCRCNTSCNLYDAYGNVVTEPIFVDNRNMYGNNDVDPLNLVLMEGNFRVMCQLNDVTRQLDHNKRIILGTKPYHITGFNDFMQEFSGDRQSVHLLSFTVRLDEPTELDDMENYVAGGKAYQYSAQVIGPKEIPGGEQPVQMTANFLLNGEIVEPSAEYPQTWIWSVDVDYAEITQDGVLTAFDRGDITVTATLAQNPNITASINVTATRSDGVSAVAFTGFVPETLSQYRTVTFNAAFYEDGTETATPLLWAFSGAKYTSYAVLQDSAPTASGTIQNPIQIMTGNKLYVCDADDLQITGKSVQVYCNNQDQTPLTVTASTADGEYADSVSVVLEGY